MLVNKKIRFLVVMLMVLSLLLASCGSAKIADADLMTLKKPDPLKTQITIMTKYSVFLDEFEKAAEEKFPQVDIVQVGNFTSNYSDEYAQRMKNGDLTDIVLTWPLDNDARACEDYLIDLAGMEFTSRYSTSMLNSIAQDGKLYYLPGPTQLRGIIYNKTMFEKNGWEVPDDFEGFVALCKQIEASGMRSLQLSFWNKEVLRYAFMGFGYAGSFSSALSLQTLQTYNAGVGSFGDFAQPAFESFERLIKEGILKPSDLEVRYPIRGQMLYNRECAMVSDGIALIHEAKKAGSHDEFAIMPFFSHGDDGQWGHMIPVQYIGMNKNLTRPANKKKYQLVLELMDFISTPEGQLSLATGNTSCVSSLSQSAPPDAPELSPMRDAITKGHFAMFPSFTNVETAMYEALAAMLRGEIDSAEAIRRIDAENQNPTLVERPPPIAQAKETFSLAETGGLVTDILREYAGTDFALFLDNSKDGQYNARGISAKLYQGDVYESDITLRVLPVLQHGEEGFLHKVTLTGQNLLQVLEHSIEDGGGFYYVSGLKMTYDPYQEPGKRIQSIIDAAGGEIKPEQLYTVAVLEGSIDESLIEQCENTNVLVKDIVVNAVKQKGSLTPAKDGRLVMVKP